MAESKCPRCGGEMEEGMFTSEGQRWVGKGLVQSLASTFGIVGIFVRAYRCKSCGFLESYAK